MKRRECKKCGCSRKLLIKGSLINNKDLIQGEFGTLCLRCILDYVGIPYNKMVKEHRSIIMECIE